MGKGAEGLSVPSKTFYMLASGAAIISISTQGSEVSNLIQEYNCGVSIQPTNDLDLFNFLTSVSDEMIKKYKTNSRNLSSKFTSKNANKFL